MASPLSDYGCKLYKAKPFDPADIDGKRVRMVLGDFAAGWPATADAVGNGALDLSLDRT